jgi:hypothetical protein
MKSGGGTGKDPNTAQPGAQGIVPYGQTGAASSRFNPNFTSVLPEDQMATAQLSDPVRQDTVRTPLLEAQDAAAIAAAQAPPPSNKNDDLKSLLALLMMRGKSGGGYGQGVSKGGGGGYSDSGYGGSASGSWGGMGGGGFNSGSSAHGSKGQL